MVIILKALSLIWVNFADILFPPHLERDYHRDQMCWFHFCKKFGITKLVIFFSLRSHNYFSLFRASLFDSNVLISDYRGREEELSRWIFCVALMDFFLFKKFTPRIIFLPIWPLSQIFFNEIQELIHFIIQKKILSNCLMPDTLLDSFNTTVK